MNNEYKSYVYNDGIFQPNWEESDKNSFHYIQNKTHYEEIQRVQIANVQLKNSSGFYDGIFNGRTLQIDKVYYVYVNDTEYICKPFMAYGGYNQCICMGSQNVAQQVSGGRWNFPDPIMSDEPFFISININSGYENLEFIEPGDYIVKIESDELILKPLDYKFLPNGIPKADAGIQSITIIADTTTTYTSEGPIEIYDENGSEFDLGQEYIILWDDLEISMWPWTFYGYDYDANENIEFACLGNSGYYDGSWSGDSDALFFIYYDKEASAYKLYVGAYDEHKFSIIAKKDYFTVLEHLDPRFLPNDAQSDWEERDSSKASFIKNKTHYAEVEDENIVASYFVWGYASNSWVNCNTIYSDNNDPSDYVYDANIQYVLILDDVEYTHYEHVSESSSYESLYFYNKDGAAVFCIQMYEDYGYFDAQYNGAYVVPQKISFLKRRIVKYHTLDENFIPQTIARTKDVGADWNEINQTKLSYIKNKPFVDEKYLRLEDVKNGSHYILSIEDGKLTTRSATQTINITSLPTNPTLVEGGADIDLTGINVEAVLENGEIIEVDTALLDYELIDDTTCMIIYREAGKAFVSEFEYTLIDIETALADFSYSKRADGTYMLTGWNKSSGDMIIPNSKLIVL